MPLNRLGLDRVTESAFLHTEVLADVNPNERSVLVDLHQNGQSKSVPTSAVHRNIGVCIYAIGDVNSEFSLIEPLRQSVLHYCGLLLPFPQLKSRLVRSVEELRECWTKHDKVGCSHVVLIGHGSDTGLTFAVNGKVSGEDVGAVFDVPGSVASTFISLCCKTGYASFAKPFSEASKCNVFIAPYHSVHGAIASQFVQTYLGHHFLDGKTFKVAFNKAQDDIPSGIQFRFWRKGKLK
ncbi:MAG: hypothetical protein RIC55_00840 [Pirellulaceae bacterium]